MAVSSWPSSRSLADARDWIAADPYVTDGVFESHEVLPFLKVLP